MAVVKEMVEKSYNLYHIYYLICLVNYPVKSKLQCEPQEMKRELNSYQFM